MKLKLFYLNTRESFDTFFETETREKLEEIADISFLGNEQEKMNAGILKKYDILMGAWGTPMLPGDYIPPPNQVYIMVTGTVAGQLTETHLERGLRLCNWGDAISHTIAESALMQILACLRAVGLHFYTSHVEKSWVKKQDSSNFQTLFRKKVCLLGFGAIARKLVPLLRAFSVQISFYDPYVSKATLADYPDVIQIENLNDCFSGNHIISNHLPNIRETDNLINAHRLSLLPDNGVVVNTARGNSLDEYALAAEHERGRLWSSLDVFKTEPPPKDHPLRAQKRCVIMCHQGGPTMDCYALMGERALENTRRVYNREPLIGEINLHQLRHMT